MIILQYSDNGEHSLLVYIVFRVLHFTRYETTILRCGGLYTVTIFFTKYFYIFAENVIKNAYTITQIMTKIARFLFSVHDVFHFYVASASFSYQT